MAHSQIDGLPNLKMGGSFHGHVKLPEGKSHELPLNHHSITIDLLSRKSVTWHFDTFDLRRQVPP